ncbi:hypothetical protein [Nocardia sp. NPDC052566]|uniref:hypothetical protein n=1 Tax=Nocardia sp. NPDC052566 TaxID=3364330 RepID=UPI0037C54C44
MLHNDDIDTALAYHRAVTANPLLARNELWSMGSFAADLPCDFTLPPKTSLRRTATEVIRDITSRGDAYLYYLISTAVPVQLAYDRDFGGLRDGLDEAITARVAQGISDPRVQAASEALIKTIR